MKTLFIALALIASGCVKIQVEESEVCKPTPLTVPGVLLSGNYTVPVSYHVDIHDLDILDSLHFLGGKISGSGLADVSNVKLDVDQLVLFNADNAGETLVDVPGSPRNLASLVNENGNGFDVTITLTGQATAALSDWVLNTNFCFSGAIDRSYGL